MVRETSGNKNKWQTLDLIFAIAAIMRAAKPA